MDRRAVVLIDTPGYVSEDPSRVGPIGDLSERFDEHRLAMFDTVNKPPSVLLIQPLTDQCYPASVNEFDPTPVRFAPSPSIGQPFGV